MMTAIRNLVGWVRDLLNKAGRLDEAEGLMREALA